MTVEVFRKRLIARLTSVPEILYALTRHWFILTMSLAVGTAFMVAKVSTDSVVFEGRATLVFNSGDAMVVERDRRSQGGDREDAVKLFNSQLDMLLSDSVMRKLVIELKAPNVLRQDENPEVVEYGAFQQAVKGIKDKIADFSALIEHPNMQDKGQDFEIQKAVASFRRRARVVSSSRTNSVELHLFGHNREALAKELQAWIDAYTRRLVEMFEESRDFFTTSRSRLWARKETEAKQELDEFKKENPDVSKAKLDLLQQQVLRLELRREERQRELDTPNLRLPVVDDLHSKDPEAELLKTQKFDYEKKLREMLADNIPESSEKVQSIKKTIQLIEQKLQAYGGSTGVAPAERAGQLAEEITKLNTAITETRTRLLTISDQLDQLQSKEFNYKQAQATYQNYNLLIMEGADKSDFLKSGQVQIQDKPTVDWEPYNTNPHRQVLMGSVGGLVIGIVCALLLEILSVKVRFKHDIYTEFGIPVAGVIPRK